MSPKLDLVNLARDVFPGPRHWGMNSLVKAFISADKVVIGKNSAHSQLSDWSRSKPRLDDRQIKYAMLDAVVVVVLHELMISKRDGAATPCLCPDDSNSKCVICQAKSGAAPLDDEVVITDDPENWTSEPTCSYKKDLFHAEKDLLEAGGVKHSSHGAGSASLSMILLCWDSVCYAALFQKLHVKFPHLSQVAIKLMLLGYRSKHPERFKVSAPCYYCPKSPLKTSPNRTASGPPAAAITALILRLNRP
jgi:hypothetical protein